MAVYASVHGKVQREENGNRSGLEGGQEGQGDTQREGSSGGEREGAVGEADRGGRRSGSKRRDSRRGKPFSDACRR